MGASEPVLNLHHGRVAVLCLKTTMSGKKRKEVQPVPEVVWVGAGGQIVRDCGPHVQASWFQ